MHVRVATLVLTVVLAVQLVGPSSSAGAEEVPSERSIAVTASFVFLPTQQGGHAVGAFECQVAAVPDPWVTFIRQCELWQGETLLGSAASTVTQGPVSKTIGTGTVDFFAGGELRVCLQAGAVFLLGDFLGEPFLENAGCITPQLGEGVGAGWV